MVHISEASADTSRIELRNRAGHDGRSKTSRISSSCRAHRTRLLARDDIPCLQVSNALGDSARDGKLRSMHCLLLHAFSWRHEGNPAFAYDRSCKDGKSLGGGQTYLAACLRKLSFETLVDIDSHGHAQSNLWTMHLSYASLASIERVFRRERQGGRIAVPTMHAMKNCRAASNAAPHCRLGEPESENLSASISDFMPHLE